MIVKNIAWPEERNAFDVGIYFLNASASVPATIDPPVITNTFARANM